MVDGHERHVQAPRERLAVAEPDEEGADQPGAARRRDGVQVRELDSGLRQRAAHHVVDDLEVLTARELGHHSAEAGVQGRLRLDGVRYDFAPSGDPDASVVARRVDAEDERPLRRRTVARHVRASLAARRPRAQKRSTV